MDLDNPDVKALALPILVCPSVFKNFEPAPFLLKFINPAKRNVMVVKNEMRLLKQKRNVLQI